MPLQGKNVMIPTSINSFFLFFFPPKYRRYCLILTFDPDSKTKINKETKCHSDLWPKTHHCGGVHLVAGCLVLTWLIGATPADVSVSMWLRSSIIKGACFGRPRGLFFRSLLIRGPSICSKDTLWWAGIAS